MEDYSKSFTGGLRYETWNWTWPFAQLTVSPNTIDIELAGKKKFSFLPDQVIGFKKRRFGIQIYHNIKAYPSLIIFWGNHNKIIASIEEARFIPAAQGEMQEDEYNMQIYLLVIMVILMLSLWGLGYIISSSK